MSDRIELPKKDDDLARMVEEHVAREENRMLPRRTRWLMAYYYVMGYRSFSYYDQNRVRIGTTLLRRDGTLPLQTSDLISNVNKISSMIGGLDLKPYIKRQGDSLEAIRQRAMAQIVADAAVDEDHVNRIQPKIAHILTLYGSVGVQARVNDVPMLGINADIEVVHPKEVYPFPTVGWDYTKTYGYVRSRLVPEHIVKKLYGASYTRNKQQCLIYRRRKGDVLDEDQTLTGTTLFGNLPVLNTPMPQIGMPDPSQEGDDTLVRVRELFITGPRNTLLDYTCTSGQATLNRESFDTVEAYCPMAWARFIDIGDFYGGGMFDLLFSVLREKERLVEDMIQNVKDLDRYPITILPHGTINEKIAFKDTGRQMRYITANPDQRFDGTPPIRPITIAPHNAGGDLPGRTATFLQEMVDQVNPLRDIIREKGRIDSLPGLQFITEESHKTMAHPLQQVALAFGDIYRYVTSRSIYLMMKGNASVPLSRLDLGLLGAVVNWDKGTVRLTENVVPDLSRLSFGVKMGGGSEALHKQEALMFLDKGHIDFARFVKYAVKKGLDFAVDMDAERAAYRMVVQNVLTVYNDGNTPGLIFITPFTERPNLQIDVLDEVLSSPEVKTASPAVINELIKYKEQLMYLQGNILPQSVPDPYDMALQQALAQGQAAPPALGQPRPSLQLSGGSPTPPQRTQQPRRPAVAMQ